MLIERESLTSAYQTILDRLLEHHSAIHEWRAVVETAQRLLAIDPLLEHAHRAAISAHGSLGERAQAARQFQRCKALLAEELGVAPLPETEEALCWALNVMPEGAEGGVNGAETPSLSTIIGELKATVRERERLNGAS